MPVGRPPLPTKLHILHGNPGRRPLNQDEPEPEQIAPECPAHLQGEARAEWDRLCEELGNLGLLTRLDRANMTGYCQSWADYLEAQWHLDNEPKIYKTETGYPVMTPWKPMRDKALEFLKAFGNELGLSAAARSRIHVEPKKKKERDPAAKYFG